MCILTPLGSSKPWADDVMTAPYQGSITRQLHQRWNQSSAARKELTHTRSSWVKHTHSSYHRINSTAWNYNERWGWGSHEGLWPARILPLKIPVAAFGGPSFFFSTIFTCFSPPTQWHNLRWNSHRSVYAAVSDLDKWKVIGDEIPAAASVGT